MTNEHDPTTVDATTRRAAIVRDLELRLGPACSEWPKELFTSMIEGLADITLRYEGQSSASSYDRRTTDRLVADLKAALTRNEEGRDREKT